MKKMLLLLSIIVSALFASIKDSYAVITAVSGAPAALVIATSIIGVGGISGFAMAASEESIIRHKKDREKVALISGIGIVVGHVLLEQDIYTFSFQEINEIQGQKLKMPQQMVSIYNSEVEEVNAVAEKTMKESLSDFQKKPRQDLKILGVKANQVFFKNLEAAGLSVETIAVIRAIQSQKIL